jgi:hypothetical protein
LKDLFAKKRRQARALAESRFIMPGPAAGAMVCCREVLRDFLYALYRLKFFSIPYNLAYRVTAHAGFRKGLREGCP